MAPFSISPARLLADVRASRPTHPTVSLVIPARNEAENLKHVLPLVPDCVTEVILVDGRSTDDTIAVTLDAFPDATIVNQTGTRGKGAAMIEGAIEASCDIIVFIDADGSMDPSEIPAFVGALEAGADLAKGSRFASGAHSHDITPIRHLGNWGLLTLANLLYRQHWSELNYGFFALWSDMLPTLGLAEIDAGNLPKVPYGHGFEIETMTFTRAARSGLRVVEVASVEYQRIHGQSSLMAVQDGFRVLSALGKERVKPLVESPQSDPMIARDASAVADETVPHEEVSVAVLVCAHSSERLPLIKRGLFALSKQSRQPDEVLVVIDHNPELAEVIREFVVTLPIPAQVLENEGPRGVSGARNYGVHHLDGAVVAFLDDDAEPDAEWLDELIRPFGDPEVAITGGRLMPEWETAQPSWWPESFNWTIGCSYAGMPKYAVEVRNPFGASMAVRREVFQMVGGFGVGVGRIGDNPTGCEETELAILARKRGGRTVYNPASVAHHFVPASRASIRYFIRRCLAEGSSKALISQRVGAEDALASERKHLGTLVRSVLGDVAHLRFSKAAMTVFGTALTAFGFARGILRIDRVNR